MRYKWVWFHGANREVSVLRWGPSSSQQVFQRARLCQTSRSRVHSLPETGAVWLSSCYWLLFLWRAGFCQVNFFFSFPLLPAVRTQTVQNCTRKHSRPSRCLQHQIVICHPVASVQYLISKWRPVQRPDAKRINETKMQNECWICNRNMEEKKNHNKILTGHSEGFGRLFSPSGGAETVQQLVLHIFYDVCGTVWSCFMALCFRRMSSNYSSKVWWYFGYFAVCCL